MNLLKPKIITPLLSIFLLYAAISFLEHPWVRYQLFLPQLTATTKGHKEIDILFIGKSGMLTFINTDKIKKQLAKEGVNQLSLVDISRNWEGAGSWYVSLRDFFKKRSAKIVVVQFTINDENENDVFHQIGTFPDLLESSLSIKNKSRSWRIQRFMRLSEKKITDGFNLLITRKVKPPQLNLSNLDSVDPTPNGEKFNQKKTNWWLKNFNGTRGFEQFYVVDNNVDWDSRNRFYFAKISKLVKDNGAQLILADMPLLDRSVMSPESIAYLEKKYEAIVFSLNQEQLARIYSTGLADHAHATESGSELYAKYFSQFFSSFNLKL